MTEPAKLPEMSERPEGNPSVRMIVPPPPGSIEALMTDLDTNGPFAQAIVRMLRKHYLADGILRRTIRQDR